MVFGNVWMLIVGGGLVTVPVVLHLLMQQKPKPLVFPAVRFLRETFVSNQRRLRLKQWLLLALRIAVIVWLAAALAQPSVASFLAGRWVWGGLLLLLAAILLVLLLIVVVRPQPAPRLLAVALGLAAATCLVGGGVGIVSALSQSRDVVLASSDGPVAAAFVLDTSPRMMLQQNNQTRLERSQEVGEWLLARLPASSQVAIAPTSRNQAYFAVDVSAARQELETLAVSYVNRSLPAQIAECLALLEESELTQRELYVFTDRSRLSWPEGPALSALMERLEDASVNLYIVDVRADRAENLWLSNLRMPRETLAQQGTLELSTDVNLVGPARQRRVLLKIEKPDTSRPVRRDGETLLPEQFWIRETLVDLNEDGSQSVAFQFPDLPPGVHHGVVEIEGQDALEFDNRRFFTVEVRPAWRALVLTGPGVSDAILTQAIAPAGERESGRALFDFQVRSQDQISLEPLEDFDAVFLMDPAPLEASAWDLLDDYVQQGGGVTVFLGPNAVTEKQQAQGFQTPDESFKSPSALKILPGELTEVWRARDEGVWLDPVNLTHPLWKPFRGRETSVPWRQFPIQRHWGLQATNPVSTEDDQAASMDPIQVIMRFSNGMPAIIQRDKGNGKVFVWTTPIAETDTTQGRVRWNDLTVGQCWPYFLLVNQLADELVSQPNSRLNYQVGQIATLPFEPDHQPPGFQFFPPRNEDPQQVRPIDGSWMIRFTETPGQYRLKGDFQGPVVAGFSVNAPDSASNLEGLPVETWTEWFGEDGYQLASEAEEIVRQQGTLRRGRSFYPMLMTLLPILLGLEFLFGNRFYGPATSSTTRRGGRA